jgi:hypothetical protein
LLQWFDQEEGNKEYAEAEDRPFASNLELFVIRVL